MSTPCFAAGTLVVTGIDSAGQLTTKNIEDVQVGDWVLTRSQDDPAGPLEQRQVTAVEVHTVTSLRLLDIALQHKIGRDRDWVETGQMQGASGERRVGGPIEPVRRGRWPVSA